MQETQSKLVKRLEVADPTYNVVVNFTIENGKLSNINGSFVKKDVADPYMERGASFQAYKRNEKWYTDVTGAANDENDYISDLAVAIVDQIVAEYEAAE